MERGANLPLFSYLQALRESVCADSLIVISLLLLHNFISVRAVTSILGIMGILETKVISPPSQITLHRNIISPMCEVKNTRGTQSQSVENPRSALLDR